tara:strand:+ start:407 stop:1627 length:1221 start_codon:yes stop_codon:yes gene_type:complete
MTLSSIPRVSKKSIEYVNKVLDMGIHNAKSSGFDAELERKFAERFGQKYGILMSNGTVTMQTALQASDIGAGDEVIVPAFTVFMTAGAALFANAIPIIADVDPDTWTLDPKDVERKITSRTRAVIPVSICGLSPDMDPILKLAKKYNLMVIEDNAQCYLGYYKERVVGSMGNFSSFSFQGSKHMTCGEGGILLCENKETAIKARKASSLGFSTLTAEPGNSTIPKELRCHPTFKRHTSYGHNFLLSELAISLALGEFERLDELVSMRQNVAKEFERVIADCDWLIPQKTPKDHVHSFWTYAIRISRNDIDWSEMRNFFTNLGGDGYYAAYQPVHREPVFPMLSDMVKSNPKRFPHWHERMPDYRETSCPVWEAIQPNIIMLKTKYFNLDSARRQAELFAKTIQHFS